jgi:hypothetical protein
MPSQPIARRAPAALPQSLRPQWSARAPHTRPAAIALALACLLLTAATAAAAQDALRADAPERYVVQPGDTLWGIAERFLSEPWRWRQVWQANPGIANPSQIYPGDVLVVDRSGGSPRIRKADGGGGLRTVKLSPRVRVEELDREIPTIPVNAVAPFLSRPLITTAAEIGSAPYVVGFPEEKIIGGLGDTLFVRSIISARNDRWDVLRPGRPYRDPDTNELLGYVATSVASARLERLGDPATLVVTRSHKEVEVGDRVRPAQGDEPLRSFLPRPATAAMRGKIIAVLNGVSQIGQYDVVALNRGRREGVEVGTVFAAYRGGQLRSDRVQARRSGWNWRNESPADTSFWYGDWELDGWNRDRPDPNAPLPLHRRASRANDQYMVPDSRTGVVMVFRAFEKVSFALVMFAKKAIHVGEVVAPPRSS